MFNKGQLAGLMKQAQAMQESVKKRRTNWLLSKSRPTPALAWSR